MTPRVDAVSILVLDDHRFMQQVMRIILTGLGVKNVVAASNVDDALRLLDNEMFDLVIADYRLKGPSGAEFTRLVRGARAGADRFIPIIAYTADTTPQVIRELRDAGADEILGKPVSPRTVCAKINALANARRKFVNAPGFFGPDRRRTEKPAPGAERRSEDTAPVNLSGVDALQAVDTLRL
jgi:two-component system, chemotaxis family, chemotaxis protein CheY